MVDKGQSDCAEQAVSSDYSDPSKRFAAANGTRQAPDKRREERYTLPVDIELSRLAGSADIPECAVLRNMSEHGVALEHSRPLRIGETVSIKLLDVPVDLPCEYRVEILWQEPPSNGDATMTSGGRILSGDDPMQPESAL